MKSQKFKIIRGYVLSEMFAKSFTSQPRFIPQIQERITLKCPPSQTFGIIWRLMVTIFENFQKFEKECNEKLCRAQKYFKLTKHERFYIHYKNHNKCCPKIRQMKNGSKISAHSVLWFVIIFTQ